MEKDHNHGTICEGNIMVKTDSVVMLLLVLDAAVVSPANVMKQEDHPNEVTWQKTQTYAQDPTPRHQSRQAALRTDNSSWVGGCNMDC